MSRILWFADAHDEPGQDKTRFDALGRCIVDKQPDIIVQGGDFSSIGSLSDWDRDKRRKMEYQRYSKDIASANESISRIFKPLIKLQKRQRKNKEKMYKPRVDWIEGNHEYRVERYLDFNPVMEGTVHYPSDISFGDARFDEFNYIPFHSGETQSATFIDGVAFTHAPRNRAGIISSKYVASRALADAFECSVVFGHTHRLTSDSLLRIGGDGSRNVHRAINGGCFFEVIPDYALNNANDYSPCVLILETLGEGRIRVAEEIPLSVLKETYLG